MSPFGMLEFGVSVVQGDSSFEVFIELHPGTGEAEAVRLGRDVEAAAFPLHDVVVADDAFVDEAADAVQVGWCRAPGFFAFPGRAGKAAVIGGQEALQDAIGGMQVAGLGQAQLAAETVLEDAPEAFDAAFGLGEWAAM